MEDDALRVVLNVRETADIEMCKRQTAELEKLKEELKDWKCGRSMPTIGEYYHADTELLFEYEEYCEYDNWMLPTIEDYYDEANSVPVRGSRQMRAVPLRYDGRLEVHLVWHFVGSSNRYLLGVLLVYRWGRSKNFLCPRKGCHN